MVALAVSAVQAVLAAAEFAALMQTETASPIATAAPLSTYS